jgi:hypothetical protein
MRRRGGYVGIRVFGRGIVWPATEELRAVGLVLDGLAGLLEGVDLAAVVGELFPELLDPVVRLFLLLGDELLPGEAAVVVERLGEGGEGGRDVANLGGRWLAFGVEGSKFATERLALPQGGVVQDVLNIIRSTVA